MLALSTTLARAKVRRQKRQQGILEKAAPRCPTVRRFQTSSLHESKDTVVKQEKWKVSPR